MIIKLDQCLVPQCREAGRAHEWEFDDFTVREMKYVQKTLGVDIDVFLENIDKVSLTEQALDSMLMLMVLMHRRDGIIVPFDDMDFSMKHLHFISDEAAPEADEKPTGPAQTSLQPAAEPVTSSTSGPVPEAESTPKSSPMPVTSGAASG